MKIAAPEPYNREMISILLRSMPADRLGQIKPQDFQRHPARKIVAAEIIGELIVNEKARRK